MKDALGIILSGGPKSVDEEGAPAIDRAIFELGKPILGICYGHQLMAHYLGGQVATGREYGFTEYEISKPDSKLFQGLKTKQVVWNNHGDQVTSLPLGFEATGRTTVCQFESMEDVRRSFYGVQFHPEVSHTKQGMELLKNFVFGIAHCNQDWSITDFMERIEQEIRDYVKDKNVFLLVSGGVDSTVCFALLNKVLGKAKVYGLHVDSGFMRLNESRQVKQMFDGIGYDNLQVYDAQQEFLRATDKLAEPEAKRRAIGAEFVKVADRATAKLGLDPERWILAQGTIYPDTIESGGTKHAARIKTHHNRVEAIEKLIAAGKLLEPIKDLYKDEVRELGIKLGLPEEMVYRHPFPGPGLAVRVLCSDGKFEERKNERTKEQNTDSVDLNSLVDPGISSQFLPIRSVGVQGDARSYAHPALISISKLSTLNWEELGKLSTQITNQIKSINRVILKLAGEEKDLKLGEAYLSQERLDILRAADDLFTKELKEAGLYHEVWQAPVVLVPLKNEKGELLILRPINSTEAMTANFSHLPVEFVTKVAEKLLNLPGIGLVAYDITNKPPGTIEWE